MSYTHLSQDQRYQIQRLHRQGVPKAWIALLIGRSPSMVGRELKRNSSDRRYHARQTHDIAVVRHHKARSCPRISLSEWRIVEDRLRQEWSPEQIVGSRAVAISIERIYQHIAQDRRRGGDLWKFRRRRRKQRRNRCGKPRDRQRFGGQRIHERPAIVETRQRTGAWEGDTIVGRGSARIITLFERKTSLLRMRRVANGEAGPTRRAILPALGPPKARVLTLTWDNGSEFAEHALIDATLGANSYFAEPYAAWQRGSNENTNGLIRQYLPKGCNLADFSDADLQRIEDRIN